MARRVSARTVESVGYNARMPLTLELLRHPIVFHRPRRLNAASAWLEHIPFAMLLVDLLRPETFVELGTYHGDSYCAVCEAVEILGLGTRCYAVDSWAGDPHAGTYGPEVLEALRRHHDPLYGRFSRLVQSTFDAALAHFADGSIDLLHIDGYHTYEAVRHDFEAWRGKLSDRAVVLFHDVNVREKDYGVWRLWEELRCLHPSFEFGHAHGLGVLGVGATLPDTVRELFDLPAIESAAIQGSLFRVGHRLRLLADLETAERELAEERAERVRAVDWLKGQLERAEAEAAERDRAVEWLKRKVDEATAALAEREQAIDWLKGEVKRAEADAERGRQLEALTDELRRLREPRPSGRSEGAGSSWGDDPLPHWTAHRSTAPIRWCLSLVERLRNGWQAIAGNAMALRGLPPCGVEAGGHDVDAAIQWVGRVQIAQVSAHALLAHPPASLTYRFTVPPRATFRSLLAINPAVWHRNDGGVEFCVSVSSRDGARSLRRRWRIDPRHVRRHRRWLACRLGFGRFANQEVTLTLTTSVPPEATVDFAHALWGDPAIVSRRPLGEIRQACAAALTLHGARGDWTVPGREIRAIPDRAAGKPASSMLGFLEDIWKARLKVFLADPTSTLAFPAFPDPLVSVVIPTFNKAEYLYQCLESLLANTDVPFEVIVVDDASRDATPELLDRLKNVACVRNEENLEFVRTCNRGIGLARGRYLVFLNNDVAVTPRWLSALVETIERDPRYGAVQGKLVRPDGTLQEAGSIVWRDGSALGYGRDDDPSRPEYSYLREVDYGSAACLLVRAELVRELGGFDERYVPAYYEDTDLCFGVRRLGRRVVFQPDVSVFHCEFSSRSAARAGALCAANQPKFAEKWAAELRAQLRYGAILRARDRRPGKRIVVMDDQIPAPHLGSGFPRAHAMLRTLAEAGFVITFVPLTNRTRHQPATRHLQQLGIEVFYGEDLRVEELLESRAGYYDVVVVSRPHNGATFLPLARRHFPRARIVYDAEALFCVRDFLKAELEGRPLSEANKQKQLRDELDIMSHADVVLTVSAAERDLVLREKAHADVVVWGHTHEVRVPVTPYARRRDILFVGGFGGGDGPNTDAVVHFATTLFPKIRERLPDARFVIAGSQPPGRVRDLASPHVTVAGYVEDLTEHYERCRLFVVPIRFAAGISMKLTEAMSAGIPAVVSEVGAAGLDLQDGREALIARSDAEFVDKVVQAYGDESRWTALQRGAAEYIRRRCAPEAMRATLVRALGGA